MPTFIKSLFEAAKVYFESRNIASFSVGEFLKVVKYLLRMGSAIPSKRLATTLGCHQRDLSGYLSLGWHLGVFSLVKQGNTYVYAPTKLAKAILDSCGNGLGTECRELLSYLFLNWAPLRLFLRFVRARGRLRVDEVRNVLGEEMRFWNSILMQLGLPVTPRSREGEAPAKPFNDYVIRKLFKPLITQLGLLDAELIERNYEIVKSRGKEPIIAAGIAHIVYSSREAVLITPFVDSYGIDLVARAATLAKNRSYVRIFARIVKGMQSRTISMPHVHIEVCIVNRPLHAKLYMSDRDLLITSANLLRTSLLRNIELGVMVRGAAYEVLSVAADLETALRI